MNTLLLCLLIFALGHYGLTITGSIGIMWFVCLAADTGLAALFMYLKWGIHNDKRE